MADDLDYKDITFSVTFYVLRSIKRLNKKIKFSLLYFVMKIT